MTAQSAREDAARARDLALVREACGDADLLRIQERGLSPHSNAAHKHRNALHRIEATILADIEEMQRLRAVVEAAGRARDRLNNALELCADWGLENDDWRTVVQDAVSDLAALKEVSE